MEINQNVLNEFTFYLKKSKYKNIIQDLNLMYCTSDEIYLSLILIRIKKSQRCKGFGSAVMYDITHFADKHNVRIKLWVTNEYGSNLKRLYGFYQKHGFILIKNDNIGEMIYYPLKK